MENFSTYEPIDLRFLGIFLTFFGTLLPVESEFLLWVALACGQFSLMGFA